MGALYVVATPIGNLGDLSPRALETLRAVDLIAAEDTRVTRKLLNHFEIRTPVESCHEHNEPAAADSLIERIERQGISIALVTDAGTPALSDPGALLVREALRVGIRVLSVPGPSALTAGLSVSGFRGGEFSFFGFLPRNQKNLHAKLRSMAGRVRTAVFFESPRRILALAEAIAQVYPEAELSVSAELSKLFERTRRGSSLEVLEMLRSDAYAEKGEYVLVLDLDGLCGAQAEPAPPASLEMRLLERMLKGHSLEEAAGQLRQEGENRNAVYAARLRVRALFDREASSGKPPPGVP